MLLETLGVQILPVKKGMSIPPLINNIKKGMSIPPLINNIKNVL
jgi:hypothetical protein